jgi:hypothetical protein
VQEPRDCCETLGLAAGYSRWEVLASLPPMEVFKVIIKARMLVAAGNIVATVAVTTTTTAGSAMGRIRGATAEGKVAAAAAR